MSSHEPSFKITPASSFPLMLAKIYGKHHCDVTNLKKVVLCKQKHSAKVSKCWKIRTRKNTVLDIFRTLKILQP